MAIKYVGPNALSKLCSLVKTALAGKINTSDIVQNTSASGAAKVPSAAVTNNLQGQVDELNTNIGGNVITRSLTPSDYDGASPTSDYLRITWGIVDAYGIISFDLSWIRCQFRMKNNLLQWRVKYGAGDFNAWTNV